MIWLALEKSEDACIFCRKDRVQKVEFIQWINTLLKKKQKKTFQFIIQSSFASLSDVLVVVPHKEVVQDMQKKEEGKKQEGITEHFCVERPL